MSSSLTRRSKLRKSPLQPSDRHLAEISESDGSIYINAGIDSTWFVRRISLFELSHSFIMNLVVKNVEEQSINLLMVSWFLRPLQSIHQPNER